MCTATDPLLCRILFFKLKLNIHEKTLERRAWCWENAVHFYFGNMRFKFQPR